MREPPSNDPIRVVGQSGCGRLVRHSSLHLAEVFGGSGSVPRNIPGEKFHVFFGCFCLNKWERTWHHVGIVDVIR